MGMKKIVPKKIDSKKILTYGSAGAVGVAAALAGKKIARKAAQTVQNNAMHVLMTDIYDENMLELYSSTKRLGLQEVMETNLRATEGKAISRPMGSPKKFPSLESLVFSIAQLYVMPTPFEEEIDVSVTIGPQAKKPLKIEIPIMIAPMAYGVALSKKAKVAIAKGAALAGTAICSGEGPVLKEEREAATKYIFQYNRGTWGNRDEDLANCDAIEIQFGQGAIAGVGHVFNAKYIDKEMREAYGLKPGENIEAHSRQPKVQEISQLPKLIEELKKKGGGVPVGAKIGAGKYLEADLDLLCNSGIDYISIDGAEAATKGSPPILQDDFGVPTIFAVNRAAEWLYKNNFKNKVSLLAGGKIRTPGDMLKVIALGADSCYIGSIALSAMSHTQVLKVLPYEPPTQLVWHHSKGERKLHIEKAAESLKNFLNACKEEIGEGIKALGKRKLSEVNKEDLMALDETVAKGCGIPMVYEPFEYEYEDE